MHLSTSLDERVRAGRAVYARNLGVTEAEAEDLLAERAGAQYAYEAFLAAGGPGWNGAGLTNRERHIAVIASLVGQHVDDQRLITYLHGARAAGVSEEGLAELMVLLTAYVGQPAPSAAMAAIRASAPPTGEATAEARASDGEHPLERVLPPEEDTHMTPGGLGDHL